MLRFHPIERLLRGNKQASVDPRDAGKRYRRGTGSA
jgi:hypothetical protein